MCRLVTGSFLRKSLAYGVWWLLIFDNLQHFLKVGLDVRNTENVVKFQSIQLESDKRNNA